MMIKYKLLASLSAWCFSVSLFAQQAQPSSQMLREQCRLVWETGEYIMEHKGNVTNMDSLLSRLPVLNLADTTVVAFMKEHRPIDFADYYYMLQALKKGESFDAARDGLGFTTRFPFRPLNKNDYFKLREVFSAPLPLLHEPYMANIEFAFQNRGCTEGLAALRPLIVQHVADSPRKQRLLALYDDYNKLMKGCMAPQSELKDAEGKSHTFAELRGKVVVVDVWATWCSSCLQKMSAFMELCQQWSHRQDVVFVTLSIDRNKSLQAWLDAIDKHQMRGTLNWRADVEGGSSFEQDYKIVGIPRYFVIDAEGRIVTLYASSPDEELEQVIASVCTPQQGIRFEELTLQQALDKADREGKKVFVDCYTQSCVPCKYMAKEIFPLRECGDYFNPRYVSLMRDMEKGEGVDIARKYNVRMYPTFLILNPDGSLYCLETGATKGKQAKVFVDKMDDAVARVEMERRYKANDRTPEFLRKYVALLRRSPNGNLVPVINELLMPLSTAELCLPENWDLLNNEINSTDNPLFERLLEERKDFDKHLGHQAVEDKIMRTYAEEFRIYKRMGLDFDKRISVLKDLEKEGYKGAQKLQYCMRLRQIIDGKQVGKIDEVIHILSNLRKQIADEKECMDVLAELSRIETVATSDQKAKIVALLTELEKGMTLEDYRLTIQRIKARLR